MPKEDLKTITKCRVCGASGLESILSLGDLYLSNFVDEKEQEELKKYPLELVLCDEKKGGCGLLQLRHSVSNELMYRNYWYASGTNQTMTDQLRDVVRAAKEYAQLAPGDTVIDIGANDGTLLRAYGDADIVKVGFEPARNLVPITQLSATKVINDFWNAAAFEREFPGKKAKIVTAIAMFYDLEDPNVFVSDVKRALADGGVFIIQMSYLPLMLSQNAFDNICHEHLEYYSLRSLEFLLNRNGLSVVDAELNDVNGGSFRVYVTHAGKETLLRVPAEAKARLRAMRSEEERLGLSDRKIYDEFARRVEDLKSRTVSFVKGEVAKGKKVYVYGASTKGNTLLQYYGLDAGLVSFAVERNPRKWGKKTVGTLIPIISEEQARGDEPHHFLVLPWHFMDEFRAREAAFLAKGGKFVVPLPEFRIVDSV